MTIISNCDRCSYKDKCKSYQERILKIIDECDPEACCHGINKKELLDKIKEMNK